MIARSNIWEKVKKQRPDVYILKWKREENNEFEKNKTQAG